MMSPPRKYSLEESGAFIATMELRATAPGPLTGWRFAVKDVMDLGGYRTSYGNPDWAQTHPPAAAHAVCVDLLLGAGAQCVGKTVTDELAFSLDGENFFYGTPLNPRAPDRVPGGSSSGSASAVACGLVDFSLGNDTGGSVRVPAANCGIFGLRPSPGFISTAGVQPFSPSLDTVGVLAGSAEVLSRVASVLLAAPVPANVEVGHLHLISEAWDLADAEVREALGGPVQLLRNRFAGQVRETSIREIDGEAGLGLNNWYEPYSTIQWAEIWSCFGSWMASVKPTLAPRTRVNFELAKNADRRLVGKAIRTREHYFRRLATFLGPHDLLCIPTVPAVARLKGKPGEDRSGQSKRRYYPRTLSITAIAGLGRLPEVSLPLAVVSGVPVGLSLLAAHGLDAFLLGVVEMVAGQAGLFR
jgi:amidase